MTFFERIYAEAAVVFGKRNGEKESLTPHSRTWRTVIERAEHALWLWNENYGPLTLEQREYAADLIVHALGKAGEQAEVGKRYAFFHTELTSLLNHERVQAGFQKRAEERHSGAVLSSLLDEPVFLEVA